MSAVARGVAGLFLLAGLIAGGIFLIRTGLYGWTIFVTFPIFLGGLVSWVFRPATGAQALKWGAVAAGAASAFLLLLGLEGLICVAMALPLAMPLSSLGSWLVYRAAESRRAMRSAAMLLLLPPGVLWDAKAVPPAYEVRTAIEIAASPERVWKHVVAFPDMPEPREWYFRAGVAYPQRARIAGSGAGAVRYCDFSTGSVIEPIEIWNEPHMLRFRVVENPPTMHELSPYVQLAPKHLHGYLISKAGEFRLTQLPGDRTLLEGISWYQHGLWPAPYWRLWSDAIIRRIHLRVMTHIKFLAEQPW
jgi:hypothetical protein